MNVKLLIARAMLLSLLATGCATKNKTNPTSGPGFLKPLDSQSITITRHGSQPSRKGPPENFTGAVRVDPLFQTNASVRTSGALVIISKDLDGVIKSCNQGAARLYGYENDELIGKPMRSLIPAHLYDQETEILGRIRRGKRVLHIETVRKRKDGSLIQVSLMVSPVMDREGKIIGASNIARDITARKLTEKNLAESFHREKLARQKAEAASRAKDDFLASLSHELRTPLNPVLLIASDASDDESLPIEIRAHFDTIRKNIELEAKLIDDLLDITRITHGKLALHLHILDLKVLLEEAISNVQAEIDEKLIDFEFAFQASLRQVNADEVRLQQVFWNILKNAVKFTPERGRISLIVKDVAGRVQISISDTGIGLGENELRNIFEAFSQGDHAKNEAHRFGGLGLGLAIARKLVEMHGGKITAASEGLEKGANFTVELPAVLAGSTEAAQPAKGHQLSVPKVEGPSICVLLVEDHEPTRLALSRLLLRRGYKVISTSTTKEARTAMETGKIDLVISDIGLPDGSGNELMKYLSGNFGLKGIALTGYGMEEDIERCIAAGFTTHLIKPVNIRALENALMMVLTK